MNELQPNTNFTPVPQPQPSRVNSNPPGAANTGEQQNPSEQPISVFSPTYFDGKKFSIKKFATSRDGWVVGASILLSSFYGYLISTLMMFAWFGGAYLASWLIKNNKMNPAVREIIAWSNLITWISGLGYFGFIGLFTSKFTEVVADSDPAVGKKYKWLATFCYVIIIVLAIVTFLLSSSKAAMEKYGKV